MSFPEIFNLFSERRLKSTGALFNIFLERVPHVISQQLNRLMELFEQGNEHQQYIATRLLQSILATYPQMLDDGF